jgi:hypothetical protein
VQPDAIDSDERPLWQVLPLRLRGATVDQHGGSGKREGGDAKRLPVRAEGPARLR